MKKTPATAASEPGLGGRVHPFARRTLVVLCLTAFVVLAVGSLRGKSITTDEVPHLTAGYAYWKTGDFRLNPEHPPLAKLAAGLPLLALDPVLDTESLLWSRADEDRGWTFAIESFLSHPENAARHRELLLGGRLPMVLFGLVLCAYVYGLTRLLYGDRAGLLALALCTFSPTVLAHARLVTTDVAVTAFWTAATYHAIRFLRTRSWGQLAATGVACGLAMASKFSGILAPAVLGLVAGLGVLIGGTPWSPAPGDRRFDDLGPRLGRCAVAMAAMGGIALGVVCVTYFGVAFPRYFAGFGLLWGNHDPRYAAMLLGRYSTSGFLEYFAVALAVKVPLGTLALAAIGALWRRRDGTALPWTERLAVLLPAVLIFAVSTLSRKNLGVRYVLPCLPLLFVVAGRVATIRWAGRWPGRAVPIALVLAVAASSLAAYPDYIPYFHEAVGGSRGGRRILDDSNVDWGQNYVALADYQKKHGIGKDELVLWAAAMYDPRPVYGIGGRLLQEEDLYLPRTGWYAIGAHGLMRDRLFSLRRSSFVAWRERHQPVTVLGGSMYVYRFWIREPDGPEPPAGFRGAVIEREAWLRQGLADLNRFLEVSPVSSALHRRRAELHAVAGRRAEARADLTTCVDQAREAVAEARRGVPGLFSMLPILRSDVIGRFPEECAEMQRAGGLALDLGDAEVAVAGYAGALETMDAYAALPRVVSSHCRWTDYKRGRHGVLVGTAAAHALRFAKKGLAADARAVSNHAMAANALVRQIGAAIVLDPDAMIRAARERVRRRERPAAARPER